MSKSTKNTKAGKVVRETAAQRKASGQIGKAPAAQPTAAESAELAKTAKLRGKRVAKQNADTIIVSKGLATGNGVYVEAQSGKNVVIQPWQDKATTRKLALVGESFSALQAHLATLVKPEARLARGVDSHNSPQSAKAIADQQRDKAKGAPKSTGKGKARTAKADKAKQPSRGSDRAYVPGTKKDESKPDTFRKYMLTMILKHKSTGAAKAAHAKSGKYPTHKLDFNWSAQQGYIKFVD
jgi:hypothetical protein